MQGERQYIVPLYQRRYSWKRENLEQLWSDLIGLVDGGVGTTHFLGSVVVAPSASNTPAGIQSWLVVDGQQRITTLSILLCAIRDHIRSAAPQLADRIDDLYLLNRYASELERYTLLPTKADRASWIALLESAPDAGGPDRVGDAYRYFRRELLQADDPDETWDAGRIEQAIAGQLRIVEVAAHADDNVFRIFESLNYTGRPLTQADLLRNYLFMRLPTRGDAVYEHQWFPLQQLLADEELEELVWLDLVLRGEDRATRESVYQSQQHFLDQTPGEEVIQDWITDLHQKARLFGRILDPSKDTDPDLRHALERLNRWGASVVHPIALHVLLAHEAGNITAQEAAGALRVVESYLVRRMIVGVASANSNRVLMTLVKELSGRAPTAEAITQALSGPRKKFPTDQQVKDAALRNSFYWTGRGPQRTFVLRCLEENYEHGEPLDFAHSNLTVEHVPNSTGRRNTDLLK